MKLKRIKKTIKYFPKHYKFKTYQCVHYFLTEQYLDSSCAWNFVWLYSPGHAGM